MLLEIAVLLLFRAVGTGSSEEGTVIARYGQFVFFSHDMRIENFQEVSQWHLDGTHEEVNTFWAINKKTTIMMVVIDALIIALALGATRKLSQVPLRLQSIFELVVDFFGSLIIQTLGEHGRKYIPFFGSLFLFLMFSNVILVIPFTAEPTRDLNVTLGQMITVLVLVHAESIRVKGLKGYLTESFIKAKLVSGADHTAHNSERGNHEPRTIF